MRNSYEEMPKSEIGSGIVATPDQQARIGQLSLLSFERPVLPEAIQPAATQSALETTPSQAA
jgi:hypothetical protein